MSTISSRRTFRAERPRDLLRGQATAVSGILRKILRIVEAHQDRDKEDDIQRPHQVFCLDGARGAGKTFSLLSLEYALRAVSRSTVTLPEGPDDLRRRVEMLERQLEAASAKPTEPPSEQPDTWDEVVGKDKVAQLREVNGDRRRPLLVHPLRIIFPGDMEQQEVLMEAIFAAIRRDIDDELRDLKDDRRSDAGKALSKQLTEQVAQGWYFARRFGVEAVIKDSMNFSGLVHKFDELNRLASDRITAWRDFVDAYLEWRGVACMAVLLDDSDVSPDLTFNILHSIRTFLNHPRIVTVIAGNLRAMRDSLLHMSMQRLAQSVRALNEHSHVTGTDWRRSERVAIEHYLEKVLPEANRFFLAKPRFEEDYKQVTRFTLADICERRAMLHYKDFHKAKFRMALRIELDRSDMPNERQTHQMEDYLSWWLYQTRYLPGLAPRSARQAQSFGEFYAVPDEALTDEGRKNQRLGDLNQKRLPVMLFSNPANHSLVQRFSDDDPNVSAWLMRQNLKSHWVGVRHFEINGRKIAEGTYTYDYIRYRIDLGLTLPIRFNGEAMPPLALLPMVRGRRRMRRFFHPRTLTRQARKIGVARWMDHAAIPGNCLCFYDIVGLPDRAFVDVYGDDNQASLVRQRAVESGGQWEAQLWAHWPELLDDNPNARRIVRYFTDIVCERLRLPEGEIRTAPLLTLLGAERPARPLKYSYYSFLVDELRVLCGAELEAVETEHYDAAKGSLTKPGSAKTSPHDNENDGLTKRSAWIARYSALATDLRRAWHAVCIHQNTLRANAVSDKPLAFSAEGQAMMSMMQNAERMQLFRLSDILDIIKKDTWMEGVLRLFSDSELKKLFDEIESGSPNCPIRYEFAGDAVDFEEERNFEIWVKGWRRIGRTLCREWPIPGTGGWKEEAFFAENPNLCLDIITPVKDGDAYVFSGNCEEQTETNSTGDQIKNMRSARDFVWLMFGLSPCLPAVIHAEIAGIIFDGSEMPGGGADNSPDKVLSRLEEAKNKLDEWSKFVASATAILRYIKTKCLQLHAAVVVSNIINSEGMDDLSEAFEDYINENVHNYIPGAEDPQTAADLFIKAFGLKAEFGNELRIMPDFAPATLFGPHWLLGLAKRLVTPDEIEIPREDQPGDSSTEGAFGETEHWLWGAHVMVAQARVAISKAMEANPPGRVVEAKDTSARQKTDPTQVPIPSARGGKKKRSKNK